MLDFLVVVPADKGKNSNSSLDNLSLLETSMGLLWDTGSHSEALPPANVLLKLGQTTQTPVELENPRTPPPLERPPPTTSASGSKPYSPERPHIEYYPWNKGEIENVREI